MLLVLLGLVGWVEASSFHRIRATDSRATSVSAAKKCPSPVVTPIMASDNSGVPACFDDFDEDSTPPGKYCQGHSTATARDLTKKIAVGNMSWTFCAMKCAQAGYMGTAGVAAGNECWCSNLAGSQGPETAADGCKQNCVGDGNPCGYYCKITQFTFTCGRVPGQGGMAGGTIAAIMIFVLPISYILVGMVILKATNAAEIIPHRAFWGTCFSNIKMGCAYTKGTLTGGNTGAESNYHSLN